MMRQDDEQARRPKRTGGLAPKHGDVDVSRRVRNEHPAGGHAIGHSIVPSDGPAADAHAPLTTRQEQALALACQGMRPAAIAAALGASPTTVRRWLRKRFEGIVQEVREEYTLALLRAVESQREIVRAAWEAYHHEREVEAALLRGELDYVRRRAVRRGNPTRGRDRVRSRDDREMLGDDAAGSDEALADGDGEELLMEEYERPRRTSQGARYLAVALAAQREMSRLQGLYDELAPPPAQVSITITRRPDGPENIPPPRPSVLPAPARDEDEDEDEDDDEGRAGEAEAVAEVEEHVP